MDSTVRIGLPLALTVVIVAASRYSFRKSGSGIDGDQRYVAVQCQKGHIFSTIWLPFMSLKAIRLGNRRLQYCPVGRHFSTVRRIPKSDLTDHVRAQAQAHRDTRIP